jgi:hypothetical protein
MRGNRRLLFTAFRQVRREDVRLLRPRGVTRKLRKASEPLRCRIKSQNCSAYGAVHAQERCQQLGSDLVPRTPRMCDRKIYERSMRPGPFTAHFA